MNTDFEPTECFLWRSCSLGRWNEERAKLERVNTMCTNQRERYYTQNTWVL